MNKNEKKEIKNVCQLNKLETEKTQSVEVGVKMINIENNLYMDHLEYHYYKMSA